MNLVSFANDKFFKRAIGFSQKIVYSKVVKSPDSGAWF